MQPIVTTSRYWKQDSVLINEGWVFDDGPDTWMVCKKHQVKWFVGSNLFSAWFDMTAIMDYRLTAEYMLEGMRHG